MRLIIVRHGQSEWNKLNLFTGFKNVDLTEHGVQEAKNAGKNIETNIDIAFTSKLNRAKDTCKIIKNELDQDFEVIENDALNERDYGDLTGQNKAKQTCPAVIKLNTIFSPNIKSNDTLLITSNKFSPLGGGTLTLLLHK